ncbi:CHRD domain-containing protein [Halalkalibaculum sp. DA3122]|uniref:CHRD domain-containing protein n=1 Tax=unclassified Halalkalibaculum TaxID=2964617 RepID=UPI0037543180
MRNKTVWLIGLLSIVFVIGYACQDQSFNPVHSGQEHGVSPQNVEGKAPAWASSNQRNFRAHLKGSNEVPPVETDAQGQAIFQVSKDGSSIDYKLIVANIENVLMAHIHNAPSGQNGGVVVWLYPQAPPPQLIEGQTQGILAEGTITADELVGSLEGQTLDALISEMKAGNTYVNVHTTQNPPGEIRGQIK